METWRRFEVASRAESRGPTAGARPIPWRRASPTRPGPTTQQVTDHDVAAFVDVLFGKRRRRPAAGFHSG